MLSFLSQFVFPRELRIDLGLSSLCSPRSILPLRSCSHSSVSLILVVWNVLLKNVYARTRHSSSRTRICDVDLDRQKCQIPNEERERERDTYRWRSESCYGGQARRQGGRAWKARRGPGPPRLRSPAIAVSPPVESSPPHYFFSPNFSQPLMYIFFLLLFLLLPINSPTEVRINSPRLVQCRRHNHRRCD